jgi:hypothetical protein
VKRPQQRGGEAARRSEPGSGRDVGQRRDLDLFGHAGKQFERLADDAVPDLIDGIDMLDLGIFQVDARLERPDQADIDVFVDRGRDQEALMVAVIGGEVGAAAAQADTQGGSHDNHDCARS